MSERTEWSNLRDRRIAEPGAADAYEAAKVAYELGRAVRELRERRGWSQAELAKAASMTQSAIARFEAGGTIPTLPVLGRIAHALGAELVVQLRTDTPAA